MKVKKYMLMTAHDYSDFPYPVENINDIDFADVDQCLLFDTLYELKKVLRLWGISQYYNQDTLYVNIIELEYDIDSSDYYMPISAKSICDKIAGENKSINIGKPLYRINFLNIPTTNNIFVDNKAELIKILKNNLRQASNFGISQLDSLQIADSFNIDEIYALLSYNTIVKRYTISSEIVGIGLEDL